MGRPDERPDSRERTVPGGRKWRRKTERENHPTCPTCPACRADETIAMDRSATHVEYVCPNCAHRWVGRAPSEG